MSNNASEFPLELVEVTDKSVKLCAEFYDADQDYEMYLYRRQDVTADWVKIGPMDWGGGSQWSHTDAEVQPQNLYAYYAQAHSLVSGKDDARSNELKVTTADEPGPRPDINDLLSVTATFHIAKPYVSIKQSPTPYDPSHYLYEYVIQRRDVGSIEDFITIAYADAARPLNYNDRTNIDPGESYEYQVLAFREDGTEYTRSKVVLASKRD